MKTIALFGATGRTGKEVISQALDKGYKIKALARNPQKLNVNHKNLEVIKGDVLDAEDVVKVIEGTDLVISVFGHVKGSPEWLQTNGTKHIVAAMKKHHIDRIISLSGGGLPFPDKDEPKFIDHLIRTIMKIAVPKVLNDAKAHAQVLRESGLDWTIVRGPRLTDGEKQGDYRVSWVGVDSGTKINRADLADFILKVAEESSFSHQMPFVSY